MPLYGSILSLNRMKKTLAKTKTKTSRSLAVSQRQGGATLKRIIEKVVVFEGGRGVKCVVRREGREGRAAMANARPYMFRLNTSRFENFWRVFFFFFVTLSHCLIFFHCVSVQLL